MTLHHLLPPRRGPEPPPAPKAEPVKEISLPKPEVKQELPTQPVSSEKTEQEKFKEDEKIAQDVLKKLQDKKINKPRWAL